MVLQELLLLLLKTLFITQHNKVSSTDTNTLNTTTLIFISMQMPKIKIVLSATDQGFRYISHKLELCPLCQGADNSMVSIITFTSKIKVDKFSRARILRNAADEP